MTVDVDSKLDLLERGARVQLLQRRRQLQLGIVGEIQHAQLVQFVETRHAHHVVAAQVEHYQRREARQIDYTQRFVRKCHHAHCWTKRFVSDLRMTIPLPMLKKFRYILVLTQKKKKKKKKKNNALE